MSIRQKLEELEQQTLSPKANLSIATQGRERPIRPCELRTQFQRDRDRITYSRAFSRLRRKTQVLISTRGDHYRTRLTHSIEVAQISRTIARALGLNEDLAEAIALAHDLGHTPFGHSGEEILDELMTTFGGFNHNRQTLRIVDILERRYPGYPGLNLSYEVREGIAKHESTADAILPEQFPPGEQPTLEAALVDRADAIAYNSHDVDDGLASGILDATALEKTAIWRDIKKASQRCFPELDKKHRRYSMIRLLVDRQVSDLVSETGGNLQRNRIENLDDVRRSDIELVAFSTTMSTQLKELKSFLYDNMYQHHHMRTMASRAEKIIRSLFTSYRKDPYKLHGKFKLRIDREPLEIIICDFIAGMTDRYAYKMYEKLGRK